MSVFTPADVQRVREKRAQDARDLEASEIARKQKEESGAREAAQVEWDRNLSKYMAEINPSVRAGIEMLIERPSQKSFYVWTSFSSNKPLSLVAVRELRNQYIGWSIGYAETNLSSNVFQHGKEILSLGTVPMIRFSM